MSTSTLYQDPAWSAIVAEAAAWIALLHGPERTPAAEQGLKRWLAEDELHRRAFELATETWNESRASVRRGAKVKLILPGEAAVSPRRHARWPLAAAAAVAALVAGAALYFHQPEVSTGVGERRILALEDGTQVHLNTATRIVVEYDKRRRYVRLQAGEALFEVAPHPDRPFVVAAGDRQVTALGTAFVVRRDSDRVAVTLVEGKVAVAGEDDRTPVALDPGERITYSRAATPPRRDRPEIDKLTAWQNGKVHISDLTLSEAIDEMNRYSAMQLAVEGEAASKIRLSGVFRTGDFDSFANAVAQTHGLAIRRDGRRIVLSGIPRSGLAAEPAH